MKSHWLNILKESPGSTAARSKQPWAELAQLSRKPGTSKRDQFLPGTEAVALENLVMPWCYLEQGM